MADVTTIAIARLKKALSGGGGGKIKLYLLSHCRSISDTIAFSAPLFPSSAALVGEFILTLVRKRETTALYIRRRSRKVSMLLLR